MYGTRDAAQNWQRKCTDTMREIGFDRGKVSPCHVFHTKWQVCGPVHGHDFVFVGMRNSPDMICEHIKHEFKVKIAITGPENSEALIFLNRGIKWVWEGLVYESDHIHANLFIDEPQLSKEQAALSLRPRKARKKGAEQFGARIDDRKDQENDLNDEIPLIRVPGELVWDEGGG